MTVHRRRNVKYSNILERFFTIFYKSTLSNTLETLDFDKKSTDHFSNILEKHIPNTLENMKISNVLETLDFNTK